MTTTQPNSQQDISSTIRAMWETRPPRIPKEQGGNAKIAGVCEGIGVRYQIDPTLVRIFFVLSLFFGGGLAVYLMAWLVMPKYSMRYSPLEAISKPLGPTYRKERTLGWWLVIGAIVFWSSVGNTPSDYLGGSSFMVLAIALVAWYLLYRKMPLPPTGLLATGDSVPAADLSGLHPTPESEEVFGRRTPPEWDPLGTAPFAWDLPEPGPAPQPKPKTSFGTWMLRILLGLGAAALLAGSIFMSAVNNHSSSNGDFGVGDASVIVSDQTDLLKKYDFGVGEYTLDLSRMEPLTEDREVQVDHGVGKLEITIPNNTPVRLECDHGIGSSNCTSGIYHADADGKMLTLKINSGIGELRVNTN